jgi:molecular chaperone GrpE
MTTGRRAGEPETPRRPAGAPEDSTRPAGGPKEPANPAEPKAAAEDSAGLDRVERDIEALLEDTQRERDEYLQLAQRARADFENYRRRAAQDARDAESRGKSSLARELVPSLDNLERALRAAGIDPDADDATAEESGDGAGLAHGVLLVYRELRATLQRAGVETYDPTGERFDPAWHEALATRAQEGTEAGLVLETIEKGYRLDGQVLRAAKVIVSE